jgi:hypothetical protein
MNSKVNITASNILQKTKQRKEKEKEKEIRILFIIICYANIFRYFSGLFITKDIRFIFRKMSGENCDKDWIIELGVRPHQMTPIDPPSNNNNENYSKLLLSIYGMTLGESLSSHEIDPYILEHIQLEKECSEQHDLTLIWSDDVSLALCFLASLAHHGEYSQEHLLQRYFQWWMNG